MRKYSRLRFVLHMIPALLGWAALMLVIWGLVFLRLTDTSAVHKLTVYVDGEITSTSDLVLSLENEAGLRGGKDTIFGEDADIRMIKARPASYSMMGINAVDDADLFIIAEYKLTDAVEWLMPLSGEFALTEGAYEIDNVKYALPLDGGLLKSPFLRLDGAQRYYLCFGVNSVHAGKLDTAAFALAKLLLEM